MTIHEVLFTECYTLIDALVWMGLGFALATDIFSRPRKKKKF